MAKTDLSIDYIKGLRPFDIASDPKVRSRFIELHQSIHRSDPDQAEEYYEQQKFFFNRILLEKNSGDKRLTACTSFSLYSCFIDIVLLNSSFDPSAKLVYILQRNYPVPGEGGKEVWESRAYNQLTPYGELAQRIQAGQLKYVDPVVIVYDDDTWKIKMSDDKVMISWEAEIPRNSEKIKGSFMKSVRADGSVFYTWMLKEEIARLQKASIKQNRNKHGNDLYGGESGNIDAGFLAAKTLKHSFKTLPKLVATGTNTQTEDDEIEIIQEPSSSSPDAPPPGFESIAPGGNTFNDARFTDFVDIASPANGINQQAPQTAPELDF